MLPCLIRSLLQSWLVKVLLELHSALEQYISQNQKQGNYLDLYLSHHVPRTHLLAVPCFLWVLLRKRASLAIHLKLGLIGHRLVHLRKCSWPLLYQSPNSAFSFSKRPQACPLQQKKTRHLWSQHQVILRQHWLLVAHLMLPLPGSSILHELMTPWNQKCLIRESFQVLIHQANGMGYRHHVTALQSLRLLFQARIEIRTQGF